MRRFPSVVRAALMILVVGSLTTALVATLPSAAEGAVVAPRFSAIGATPTIPETSPPPAESRQMDDLAPLGSAQPHSHAPLGVDGERPHISGQAGLNLSTNWSGEVDSGAGHRSTALKATGWFHRSRPPPLTGFPPHGSGSTVWMHRP